MEARDRWREHVEQWKASGLTAAQYGDRAGWCLGRETRACVTSEAALATFVEVRTPEDSRLELELAGGRRLRVPASFDPAILRRLVDVLEGGS
ncbi:MAG: hypothetical protein ABSC94_28745 [Polyangiaceae bacterium]|jgi:hypothetical protein